MPRSYSRISGSTSDDSETGRSSGKASRTKRSRSGRIQENSRLTATDSGARRSICRPKSRSASGVGSARVSPSADARASISRHRFCSTGVFHARLGQAVEPVAVLPAQAQHVGEARGGDESDFRPFAFQHRVGAYRGAVDQVDGGRIQPQLFQALGDRARRVVGRRKHLGGMQPAIDQRNEVGERAAGIDADPGQRIFRFGAASRRCSSGDRRRSPVASSTLDHGKSGPGSSLRRTRSPGASLASTRSWSSWSCPAISARTGARLAALFSNSISA